MYNKMKLKPFVIPMIYGIAGFTLLLSVFFLIRINSYPIEEPDDDTKYVDKETIEEDEEPVIGNNVIISRPYNNSEVKVVKSFYDYKAEEKTQQESIIFYENTYMQNSGTDYSSGKPFDVFSILDGTVLKVSVDNILGNWVEIRHNNDLISTYQCLSESAIKENDTVTQGQIIGKSGTCNISKTLGDHLHFELFYKGMVVDPEMFFDKNLKDL